MMITEPENETNLRKVGEHRGSGIYVCPKGRYFFWTTMPASNPRFIGGLGSESAIINFMEGYARAIKDASKEIEDLTGVAT